MKKFILLVLMSSSCYANIAPFDVQEGVHIVSDEQFAPFGSDTLSREIASRDAQMKSHGYVESESPNAKTLMSVVDRTPDKAPTSLLDDPYNFYLRANISDIKLGFHYSSVSGDKLLGFAPIGTYRSKAWTGIKEFFVDKDFGTCALASYHIQLSRMGINIRQKDVMYVVNNYPGTYLVEGSDKGGYVYTLTWVDNTFNRHLECAKTSFEMDMKDKMVVLANEFDKK